MSASRRTILTGLASLGAATALPAWAQTVGAQSDPYAQVDPYADPRNGFPSERAPAGPAGGMAPQNPMLTDKRSIALSDADREEIQAGHMAYPFRLRRDGGANANPKLQKALRDFCQPIFAVADRSQLPWVVTLVNNPQPNASAGAGGTVVVRTGIISIYDHPSELAAILAHEAGHVDHRHVVRGGETTRLIEYARAHGMNPISNDDMIKLMPQVEGGVKDYLDLVDKAYSRDDEAEADAHILTIFERLGVDPKHAANGLRVLDKLDRLTGGGAPNEWVTDHPLSMDRVRDLERRSAMAPKPKTDFVFAGWDVLKAAFPTLPAFRKA